MKRDFLKNLGIEDKDLIDKILDENSSDIGRAKGELDSYKEKITNLENDLKTKTDRITELEKSNVDIQALQDKITQLETDNGTLKGELDTKVAALLKNHAIENGVRDAKAKNVKAVMALLDLEKVTFTDGKLEGLSEQLESLTQNESYLFGDSHHVPVGTNPARPDAKGGTPATNKSFADAIADAINNQTKQ